MASFASRCCTPVLGLAMLVVGPPVLAGDAPAVEILGLSPERVAGFRVALREFLAAEPRLPADGLLLESRWTPRPRGGTALSRAWELEAVPWDGRDLAFEEDFLIAGREQEHERAARRWVEDAFRGPVATDQESPRRGTSARIHWYGGPWAGVSAGPVLAGAGVDGWRIRVRQPLGADRGHPWKLRASLRNTGDGTALRLTLGRGLLASRRR